MNRRSRALARVLVRVSGCLALLSGLLLGAAAPSSAAAPVGDPLPPRMVPVPPGARGGALLTGQVTPSDAQVAPFENGDFVITLTNSGSLTAQDVRVLLDDGAEGNGVGSADGRCLSRLDAASPADLWCELGDVAPQQTVTVAVHAYMYRCVWLDPTEALPQLNAPAFLWRVAYTDDGQARVLNGPTPRWSCADSGLLTSLDTTEGGERP
jgi:hypothetical protein